MQPKSKRTKFKIEAIDNKTESTLKIAQSTALIIQQNENNMKSHFIHNQMYLPNISTTINANVGQSYPSSTLSNFQIPPLNIQLLNNSQPHAIPTITFSANSCNSQLNEQQNKMQFHARKQIYIDEYADKHNIAGDSPSHFTFFNSENHHFFSKPKNYEIEDKNENASKKDEINKETNEIIAGSPIWSSFDNIHEQRNKDPKVLRLNTYLNSVSKIFYHPMKAFDLQTDEDRKQHSPEMKVEKETMVDEDICSYSTLDLLLTPLRKHSCWDEWNPREICMFESSICAKGKNFYEIAKIVGTKNCKQCVQFYYHWKCTSHYRIWKALGKTVNKKRKSHFKVHQILQKSMNRMNNVSLCTGYPSFNETHVTVDNNSNSSKSMIPLPINHHKNNIQHIRHIQQMQDMTFSDMQQKQLSSDINQGQYQPSSMLWYYPSNSKYVIYPTTTATANKMPSLQPPSAMHYSNGGIHHQSNDLLLNNSKYHNSNGHTYGHMYGNNMMSDILLPIQFPVNAKQMRNNGKIIDLTESGSSAKSDESPIPLPTLKIKDGIVFCKKKKKKKKSKNGKKKKNKNKHKSKIKNENYVFKPPNLSFVSSAIAIENTLKTNLKLSLNSMPNEIAFECVSGNENISGTSTVTNVCNLNEESMDRNVVNRKVTEHIVI